MSRSQTVEDIRRALQQEILSGNLPPGSPLRETRLAGRLEVSRNTLREAFQGLVASGLLTYRPNCGVTVSQPTLTELAETYRVRRILELAGVEALDLDRLDEIERSVAAIEHAAEEEDWWGLAVADIRFHTEIVRAIGSPRLDRFFETLLASLRLAFTASDRAQARSAPPEHIAEHRRILEACASGERAAARRVLAAHLDLAEALLLEHVEASNA